MNRTLPKRRHAAARVAGLLTAASLALLASSARAQEIPSTRTLALGEAVAIAKARAPSVRAAFARVASAEALVDRARGALLPSASLQGSGTGFASNGQVFSGGVVSSASTETYLVASAALNLQWTLYDFGRTSSGIDAATAGVDSAAQAARATEDNAMAETAIAYFTVLADEELVAAARSARADREHLVGITHHLVEGGYRTPLDETRAKIALDVADLELSSATTARDSDIASLTASLLLDPRTTLQLTPPAPLPIDEGAALDGTVALQSRRDVAAAGARVEQARHAVDWAKRSRLPVLSASASGQILYASDSQSVPASPPASGTTTMTTTGPTEILQGTLTMSVPLFDAATNANVRGAEAGLVESQAALDEVTLAARTAMLQASRQARGARASLEQAERLAAGTAANLAAVEDRYASGLESPFALADAQREDAVARVAIVRAELAYHVAQVKMLAGTSRAGELLKAR